MAEGLAEAVDEDIHEYTVTMRATVEFKVGIDSYAPEEAAGFVRDICCPDNLAFTWLGEPLRVTNGPTFEVVGVKEG